MIFRQLFDPETSTYTYLVAPRPGGPAALVDPVDTRMEQYLRLLRELDLTLTHAIDTHVHADHVTALGELRERLGCVTVMGQESGAECVSRRVSDGEIIDVGGLAITALHTPGHTRDSYSFVMGDRVLTGDTLLIRGSGRTDFQNGDAATQYRSIHDKLLTLPDDTRVYPGHDYKGWTVSTIGEERRHNPRLQVADVHEYVAMMGSLGLADPRMMDVAVPANLACGQRRAVAGGGR